MKQIRSAGGRVQGQVSIEAQFAPRESAYVGAPQIPTGHDGIRSFDGTRTGGKNLGRDATQVLPAGESPLPATMPCTMADATYSVLLKCRCLHANRVWDTQVAVVSVLSDRQLSGVESGSANFSNGSRVPLRRRGFTAVNLTFEGQPES